MEKSTLRVLVVDDYERWRSFITSTLQNQPELRIIGEATDGLEAVQIAQQLQPDLIMLDVGLPKLNGIEAARRIREVSPRSRILFVSENRSREIAEKAVRTGALGYVVKSDAASELLPAVEAVLQDKQFVSASLTGPGLGDSENEQSARHPVGEKAIVQATPHRVETPHHHDVGFYSDDQSLLEDVTRFIGAAFRHGNGAIIIATESHRSGLVPRLQAQGVDIGSAIEQKRYIALDAAETLATLMVDGMLDASRFVKTFGNLIMTVTKAVNGQHPRIAIFGECVQLLWAQGDVEAAIQMEKLGNQLTDVYDVDILCGYCQASGQGKMDAHTFQRICAEHSTIYSR